MFAEADLARGARLKVASAAPSLRDSYHFLHAHPGLTSLCENCAASLALDNSVPLSQRCRAG